MGSLAPGKTLFAHWVLALAKMLVLTSCAADKMLFLASPSLKEMFLESSFQREDVQIDYNTCSRARYLCEPGFLAFFFFFFSPWLPFHLLLYGDDIDSLHFGSWNTVLLPNLGVLHHFVSLSCSLTQTGWLFSKCVLCILSHWGSLPTPGRLLTPCF